jgi:CspA family cold shock protein
VQAGAFGPTNGPTEEARKVRVTTCLAGYRSCPVLLDFVLSGRRAYDEIVPPRYVIATVREWTDEEGWGVLSADEIPEGIWAHFSAIAEDPTVFRSLAPGERVEVDVQDMSPGDQDGFRYRARSVRRHS